MLPAPGYVTCATVLFLHMFSPWQVVALRMIHEPYIQAESLLEAAPPLRHRPLYNLKQVTWVVRSIGWWC